MSSDKGQPVELLGLDIDQILQFFVSITSTKAIQYLGAPLVEGQEAEKDLGKARLSIDCTKYMVEKLAPYLTGEESKQLNAVISNLQFAYVRESS